MRSLLFEVSGNSKAVSRSIFSANASSSSSTVSAPTPSTEIIDDLPAPTILSQKDTENASLDGPIPPEFKNICWIISSVRSKYRFTGQAMKSY